MRDKKIDNIKGILIYLVVLCHMIYSYTYYNSSFIVNFFSFIYVFHMPFFCIIS